jgi:hypothetical protein
VGVGKDPRRALISGMDDANEAPLYSPRSKEERGAYAWGIGDDRARSKEV